MRTRAALLTAAVDVIAERGWNGAGTRAVTEHAGVPLGALNYHFEGKDQLFRQAAVGELREMFATPTRIMQQGQTIGGLIDEMLRWSQVADVTTRQQVLLLEMMLQSRRDSELSAMLAGALRGYRDQLAEALRRVRGMHGVGDEALTSALASALVAHCDGLFLHAMIEPAFPHAVAADAAGEVWFAALGSRRADAST